MPTERTAPPRPGLQRLLDGVSWLCALITGIALVVLTVIFGWLVYGRYVLNSTPTWVEQVSLLLVALITFLGAAVGIHENTHLGVSYFREISPRPVRWVFTLVSHIVMAAFGVVMMVNSYKLAAFKWTTEIPLLGISEGWRTVPITICGGLIFIFSIGHLVMMAKGIEEKSHLAD